MTLRLSEDETTKEITALRRTVSALHLSCYSQTTPSLQLVLKKFKAHLKIEPQQVKVPSIPLWKIFQVYFIWSEQKLSSVIFVLKGPLF